MRFGTVYILIKTYLFILENSDVYHLLKTSRDNFQPSPQNFFRKTIGNLFITFLCTISKNVLIFLVCCTFN